MLVRLVRPAAYATVMALVLLTPVAALPQNNEPIYRSWYWSEESLSPRVAGLGGAYVGLADDASTATLNPSGLVNLPIPGDLQIDYIRKPRQTLASGDRLSRQGETSGSLGVHFSPRWAVGLSIVRPKSEELFIGTRCADHPEMCPPDPTARVVNPDPFLCTPLPDGSCDLASLRVGFVTYAASVAHRATWLARGLSLGFSLGRQQVKADGISNRDDVTPDHTTMPHMHDNSTGHPVWWMVGAHYQAGRFTFGTAYRPAVTFGFTRALASTGTHIPEAIGGGPPSPHYTMTIPSRLSFGLAWRHDFLHRAARVLVTTEGDRIFYGRIAEEFTTEPAAASFPSELPWTDVRATYRARDYDIDDAWEHRLGTELTFRSLLKSSHKTLRRFGLQLRGGLHVAGRGSVRYSSAAIPSEQGVFSGPEPRTQWSTGAAMNNSIFRLEFSYVGGGYRPAKMFGISIRYPGFF
jgi:hypothetical protein